MSLNPYLRIMRAAKAGKGVRLSASEVECMSYDDAIVTLAQNILEGEPVEGGFYTADKRGFNRKEADQC